MGKEIHLLFTQLTDKQRKMSLHILLHDKRAGLCLTTAVYGNVRIVLGYKLKTL